MTPGGERARGDAAERGAAVPAPASRLFDPAAGAGVVRWVPLDRLVDPLAVSHANGTIERYRRAMEAGDRFPPIAVVRWLGVCWVANGHKRLAAARSITSAPDDPVPVEVWGLRRWTRDQLRQARGELAKAARIPGLLVTDPPSGLELLLASPRHWLRVARSLGRHGSALLTGRRRPAR